MQYVAHVIVETGRHSSYFWRLIMSVYDDLKSFDHEFVPEHAFRPDISTLSDGDYDFEIVNGDLTKANNGARILNLGVRANGGMVVQRTYWLTDNRGMNELGADLMLLGIDVKKWGSGPGKTSIADALPAAVKKLPGLRFRGGKRTETGKDGKLYHKLYIGSLIVSAKPGTAAPPAAPVHSSQNFSEQPVKQTIPF